MEVANMTDVEFYMLISIVLVMCIIWGYKIVTLGYM